MLDIVALDHIQLAMPKGQEEKARHFYGEVLRFVEVAKPGPLVSRGGCWFTHNGIHLHLGVMPDFTPATKAHPAFRVADLEAARQRCLDANIQIKPDDTLPHVRRFYINDPFGNRIEFIQDGDNF
ncbi:MAG: VOC family protein [Anaerolineales bacterium]|nr:VOC family protein [Anaerolineales bacterium]MCA9927941.1 VOC family protein [Anaerolineales bacterium]